MRADYKVFLGNEGTQEDIDKKVRSIRLNNDGKINTLAEVIYRMVHKNHHTYYPKGKLHCSGHRRRTFDDIYKVAKRYLSNITLMQVREALSDLRDGYIVHEIFCKDVKKRTFGYGSIIIPTVERIKQIIKI